MFKKKKSPEVATDDDVLIQKENKNETDITHAMRRSIRELIAPNGVNPNPLDHFIIHDNGIDIYTICLYIHKLPKKARFASTFSSLFNYPNVTSNVFIDPLVDGKSSKILDKRIQVLETEALTAAKSGDRNLERKLSTKLVDTESYATNIDSGENILYDVQFLFVLQSPSLENLKIRVSDFNMIAREKGIELQACYGVHPEAFISSYPTNFVFKPKLNRVIKTATIKKHIFDKESLSTIFNHTVHYFSHKEGVAIGKDMDNGQIIYWDNYDPSHDGFGVVFTGKTGAGKSATVKIIGSRNIDRNVKIRSVDFDSPGGIGEYALMAINHGGVNYEIKPGSKVTLNLFDVSEEMEYDKVTKLEFRALHLLDKISDLKNIILTMIKDGEYVNDFADYKFLKRIVTDTITELYNERDIYEMQPDSIYQEGQVLDENLQFTSGKVKKTMPTMKDFFFKVLAKQKANTIEFHNKGYQVIVDTICDYVKEAYYCPVTLKEFTKTEFEALEVVNKEKCYQYNGQWYSVKSVIGIKAYFDGQSTIEVDPDLPHINFDISQLPKDDKMIALLICMSFLNENCVKKNSANPTKAQRMVVIIDELHKTFVCEEARLFVSDAYRTYRKRNVGPWSITQAISDYDVDDNTRAIAKNATSTFLFKQDYRDYEFIKKNTPLTDSQVKRVISLGGDLADPEEKEKRRGECCLIDNGRAVFVKINYLVDSEALIVETSADKIKTLYKGA